MEEGVAHSGSSVALDVQEAHTSREIRRALARELHDRVAQALTTMLIELENFKLEQTGRQSALRQLDELQVSTRDVLANLRGVLTELRGEPAVEDGFVDSIRVLLAKFEARTAVTVKLSVTPSWPARLGAQGALNLYRIVEEALTNVRLHSGAQLVEVILGKAPDQHVTIEIRDDGRGYDSGGFEKVPGMGVLGMRERALILGGRVEFERPTTGGTTVRAVLPLEQVL